MNRVFVEKLSMDYLDNPSECVAGPWDRHGSRELMTVTRDVEDRAIASLCIDIYDDSESVRICTKNADEQYLYAGYLSDMTTAEIAMTAALMVMSVLRPCDMTPEDYFGQNQNVRKKKITRIDVDLSEMKKWTIHDRHDVEDAVAKNLCDYKTSNVANAIGEILTIAMRLK